MTRPIAVLFAYADGPYSGLDGVDVWCEARDARTYPGPHPVACHPPCERWGRYWSGGPSAKVRRVLGDDGGCFASALASVRRWGGVLEHPEASHAWRVHGIIRPPKSGGWVAAGDGVGWTCCVEQGHYGHRARKATWLYSVGCELPSLRWGRARGCERIEPGYHSTADRRAAIAAGTHRPAPRPSARERAETPAEFRDMLIAMARSAAVAQSRHSCAGTTEGRGGPGAKEAHDETG